MTSLSKIVDSIFKSRNILPLALEIELWYNESMSNEIVETPEIITKLLRIVADSLIRQAEVETSYYANAGKMTKNRDILATILWDIATNGVAILADGTEFRPESYADWLSTVKYLATHIDGPVAGEDGMAANVFKVYVGVNVDRI